ncbi:general secretion pathway protein L [Paraburkholderia kururiensis]|uniref:type II secretion system protein GspL n=1 Tax=Paraburkholderia kururiensis TaxID=984307 RepID=UPI0039A733E2
MSTLIVLMPPRDPAVPSQEWQLPELPFLLVDKAGRTQRAGRSALALLPRATQTVLMIAARDVLMIPAAVPPLKGPRLRQALPNVVEDHLIQDPQHCHLALDPLPLPDGRQIVAVIDRAWFRFFVDAFTSAGHRNLHAVPVTRCLPAAGEAVAPGAPVAGEAAEPGKTAQAGRSDVGASGADTALAEETALDTIAATPVVAALLGKVAQASAALFTDAADAETATITGTIAGTTTAAAPRVELAVARGAQGEGLAVPASSAAATLDALAAGAPLTVYTLTDLPGEPQLASSAAMPPVPNARPLTFEALARRAPESRFDLCQFEFMVQPWRLDRATLRRLRLPLALVAASLVAAIIGANVQWLMMARQRDTLSAQMTETLLNAFPKTTVVLDAPDQMSRQLQQLRVAAGELSPADFLSLSDGLARSLGPVPVNGIAALDYHDRRLDVTFKPEVKVDPDFGKRLERNGLSGAIDSNTGKWTIRSGS